MLKLNWNSGNNCRQVLIVAMFSFLCSEAVLAGSMNSEGPTTPAKSAPPDLVHGEDSAHKELCGIGMVIRQKSDKTVGLGGVVPGGPAEKAGILESDELVSVDGQGIEGKSVMALVAMIRGVPHTTVNIVVRRNGKLITYSLVREKITLPSGGSCALKHKNQSPPKI